MKKMKKHWIFIAVLTAAMVLITSACENPAGPNRGTGGENPDPNIGKDGLTPATAWVVYNVETLTAVGKAPAGYEDWTLDKHYIQTEDITLTDNWTAIGNNSTRFTGSYDGGNFEIQNLTISASGTQYQGLFGYIGSGGTVKNVRIVDVDITGGNNTGGVAGEIWDGTVQNCSVTGDVSGGISTGGVAGNNNGTVKNCYASGTVKGTGNNTGGVVGTNDGTVQNCYGTSDVSGGGNNTGGVVGSNTSSGTVQNCYATGAVVSTGSFNFGGVAGETNNTVKNCVALNPSVSGNSSVGRVFGLNNGFGTIATNYARINMDDPGSGKFGGSSGAGDRNGASVASGTGAGQYNNQAWWTTPGWTINAAGSGSEASPWEWNSTDNLPKLWFE